MNILELRLLCRDLPHVRRFYTETLGLARLAETVDSVTIAAGDTRLTFVEAPRALGPRYHFAMNIAEDLFEDAKTWLGRRVRLLAKDGSSTFVFDTWNAHAAYFTDPAGNIVEFIARHTIADRRGRGFGPGAILGISEIGLPVARVAETVAFLTGFTGSTTWGRPSEQFAAVGDENGLFIVVPARRPWFPTDVRAEVHPLSLVVRGPREWRVNVPGTPYMIASRPA